MSRIRYSRCSSLSAACLAIGSCMLYAQDTPLGVRAMPGVTSQASSVPPLQLQQTAGGSVSGRVVCSDTQHPARFAQVNLIPTDAADSDNRGGFGPRGGSRTDLDGAYNITNVAPGDYYVAASATGYISEAALLTAAGADMATALSHLPTVHVSANAPSTVNVSIDRGGVIAGRVQWDDGSPATGVQLNVVSANQGTGTGGNQGFNFGGFGGGGFGQTDDRGQFRLTGLAPGDYLVRTALQAPAPANGPGGGGGFGRNSSIVMYAPGKVRRTDAQTITVHTGEERTDLVIVLDLNALHKVSGRVSGTSGTVASGTVRLVDSTDASLTRTGSIDADGSYSVPYVPAGTYTLSVTNASSNPAQQGRGLRNSSSTSGTSFQPLRETLSVTDGDLTDLNLTLAPVTPSSSP